MVIFIILAYYVINLFTNRNQNNIEIASTKKLEMLDDTNIEPPQSVNIDIENDETTEITDEQKDSAYTITREDCTNECTNLTNTSEKAYCNQVCGFTSVPDDQNCDELNNLEKDYCLRDYAIFEKDIKLCSEIQDAGIQKQCKNRISEDIMDEIM